MSPHRTAPTYEGRRLPRPDDEVQDQGLAFDVSTMVSRRGMLQMLGIGTAAVGLTACGAAAATGGSGSSASGSSSTSSDSSSTSTTSDGEIPEETAGPYPGDGSNGANVLTESGVVRSDITSSFGGATGTAEGIPMTLTLSVYDLAAGGTAFEGAAVYVWHCDRDGNYSLYSDGITDENYLRGVQQVDANGQVTFTSIFPACYSGRWPHIHFEVYPDVDSITDATNAIATSQVALPQDVCEQVYATDGYSQSVSNLAQVSLTSDNVFGDDGGVDELGVVSGSVSAGYTVKLDVGVDTTTAAGGGGSAPSGGGGMGEPPSGGQGGPGGGGMGGTPPTGTPPSGAPSAAATTSTTSA